MIDCSLNIFCYFLYFPLWFSGLYLALLKMHPRHFLLVYLNTIEVNIAERFVTKTHLVVKSLFQKNTKYSFSVLYNIK